MDAICERKQSAEDFVLDEGVYEVFIDTDGKTYQVENTEGKGFANAPMRGNLKIVKTSSDGKVEGFAFRITGATAMMLPLKQTKTARFSLKDCGSASTRFPKVNNSVSAMYIPAC